MPEDALTSGQPFSVMAKPVGSLCNMKCSYCYYSAASRPGLHPDDKTSHHRMTDGSLERFISRYVEASEGPIVSFVWHGGEPALAGLDFYRRAVELQKRYLPGGWSCWNNLQTNGTLLDDEWCRFLAQNGFDVGVSIDGAQWVHDKFRKDINGNVTYARVKDAVCRLQANGIQPDLLCTVTSETASEPLAVYRALRDLKAGWIQFIPIVRRESGAVTDDSVTGDSYGEFLCAVFDEWALNDIGKLSVQLFEETAQVWAGGSAGLCWMAPTCGRVLVVEQDCGVYSCDHYVTPEYRIGDLNTGKLAELVDSPAQRRFGENKRDSLPAQCRSCQWLAVCNGGCPKDRFVLSGDGEPGLNYLCGGLRRFFSYVQPAINLVTTLGMRGMAPVDIMAHLRSQLSAIWKNVGRNDPCPCGSGNKAKRCCWAKWH